MATVNDRLRKLKGTLTQDMGQAKPSIAMQGIDIRKTPLGPTTNALGQARAPGPLPASQPMMKQESRGNFNFPDIKEPQWLTKENAPTMGWQQRTAINQELAKNYRERLGSITDLEQSGIQARTALKERGMIEQGLGTRQEAGFGQETSERLGRQAFTTGEREAGQTFTTGEREAKQGFLAQQAKEGDIRKYAGESILKGGDVETLGRTFNNAEFGFADFADVPQATASTPFKVSRGKSESVFVPGKGFQMVDRPDLMVDESRGIVYPVNVGQQTNQQGVQGLRPTNATGATGVPDYTLTIDGESVAIPADVIDLAEQMSEKDADFYIRRYIANSKKDAKQYK